MKHYETLGIKPGASEEQVRAAYRLAAKRHHPDRKGGSEEKMAEANRAYQVLSNPDLRAQYDETGDDAEHAGPVERARERLMQMFDAVIEADKTNPVRAVSEIIGHHKRGIEEKRRSTQAKAERLTKKTGKVRVKHGENIAQMLLDKKLRESRAMLAELDRELATIDVVSAMLKAYECDEVEVPPAFSAYDMLLRTAV